MMICEEDYIGFLSYVRITPYTHAQMGLSNQCVCLSVCQSSTFLAVTANRPTYILNSTNENNNK